MSSDDFTRAYVRLIREGQQLPWLPWRCKVALGRRRGLSHSFLRLREATILERMQRVLGLSPTQAQGELDALCASTGVATHMIPHLPHVDKRWIDRHVQHEGDDGREVLRAHGGVVLTHHSYHHNLLASCFKGWGIVAYPLANPPTAFGSDDFLHRFTLDLNAKTEANLLGEGRFLYVDDRRTLLKGLRNALEQHRTLYVLCDFDEDAPSNVARPFLGGSLRVPSGALRVLAAQPRLPVYFAGFRFDLSRNCYRVGWRRLSRHPYVGGSCEGLDAAYVTALEAWVRAFPQAWQGWEHS